MTSSSSESDSASDSDSDDDDETENAGTFGNPMAFEVRAPANNTSVALFLYLFQNTSQYLNFV